jgi:hypothetical protein
MRTGVLPPGVSIILSRDGCHIHPEIVDHLRRLMRIARVIAKNP